MSSGFGKQALKKIGCTLLLTTALSALLIGLFYFTVMKNENIPVQSGTFDLSPWNGGTVSLAGEWEFYWQKLLDEDDFQSGPLPDCMARVPGLWNEYVIDGREAGGYGYATYRLRVTGARPGSPLSLRVAPFATAYELYIDDKLSAACGRVGTSPSDHMSQYRLIVFEFTPEKSSFDLILHISNFNFARGGAWYTPVLGSPEAIRHLDTTISNYEFFLFGSYFVILMLCGYLYFLSRDRSLLLFMGLCVLFAGRIMIYGVFFLNDWFPALPFAASVRIDYATIVLIPFFLVLLMRYFYPQVTSARAVRVLLYYTGVTFLHSLVGPISFISRLNTVGTVIFILTILYVVYLLVETVRRERTDTHFLLAGILALVAGGLFDTYLISSTNFGYLELSPVCFLVMMLLWLYVYAQGYFRAVRERECALRELSVSNELKRQTELKFLKAQIRPHFIHNALNAIISISRTDAERARALLVEFSKYLRNCFDIGGLEDVVPLENELALVRSYLVLEQARFGPKLRVVYERADVSVCLPPLVLQPLVENAVIHGIRGRPGGGTVRIYIENLPDGVRIGVRDDGFGISEERLGSLLSAPGDGSGIALANINERLMRLYGRGLTFLTPEGGGLDVSMLIPTKRGN